MVSELEERRQNPIACLWSLIDFKIPLPPSLAHTPPEIYYLFHHADAAHSTNHPLLAPLLFSFSDLLPSPSALHCTVADLTILTLKRTDSRKIVQGWKPKLTGLRPDAREFTSQAASHQPHKSCGCSHTSVSCKYHSTNCTLGWETSMGMRTCPLPLFFIPPKSLLFFFYSLLLSLPLHFLLLAIFSFHPSMSLYQLLRLGSKLVISDCLSALIRLNLRLMAEYRSLHYSGFVLSYPLSHAETVALVISACIQWVLSQSKDFYFSKGILTYRRT